MKYKPLPFRSHLFWPLGPIGSATECIHPALSLPHRVMFLNNVICLVRRSVRSHACDRSQLIDTTRSAWPKQIQLSAPHAHKTQWDHWVPVSMRYCSGSWDWFESLEIWYTLWLGICNTQNDVFFKVNWNGLANRGSWHTQTPKSYV